MQNRYVGDIGDYVKYGLLRALSDGLRLGVAWYLYPNEDTTNDGRHVEYLHDPGRWRSGDKVLFDTLKQIVDEDRRSVAAIEESKILKGCKFSNEALSAPEPIRSPAKYRERRAWRSSWFERVEDALQQCDIVFVDPDNGLCEDEKFKPSGARKSWKRIPLREARALADGRTAVIYHHNTRRKGGHLEEIQDWMRQLGSDTLALRWRAWSNRAFFIVNPAHDTKRRLDKFVRDWSNNGSQRRRRGPEVDLITPSEKLLSEGKEMSMSEIKSKFQSEWILIGDPDTDAALNVLGGKVLCHSKDRDEVYREALLLRPLRSAFMYTGRMPKDAAIIL